MTAKRFCGDCGAALPPEKRFCTSCGAFNDPSAPPPTTPVAHYYPPYPQQQYVPVKPRKSFLQMLGTAAGVLLLLCVGITMLANAGKGSAKTATTVSFSSTVTTPIVINQPGWMDITVTNTGTNAIQSLAINVPDSLLVAMLGATISGVDYHEGGDGRTFYLGTLSPSQIRTVRVNFTATQVGSFYGTILIGEQANPGGKATDMTRDQLYGRLSSSFTVTLR